MHNVQHALNVAAYENPDSGTRVSAQGYDNTMDIQSEILYDRDLPRRFERQ
jgi:hypothetical protein